MSKLPRNVKPNRLLKHFLRLDLKNTREKEVIEGYVIQMVVGHRYQFIQSQLLKEPLEKFLGKQRFLLKNLKRFTEKP